jgi:hypothetical protein
MDRNGHEKIISVRSKTEIKGMTKALQKQLFGVPSLETAKRIDDVDMVEAMQAAHYRLCARMRELELQFEAKASELRAAFLAEIDQIRANNA